MADSTGVRIYGFPLPESCAVSVMDGKGLCCIGIDNSRNYSISEEKTMLAHELGHCRTGTFYNEHTPLSLRSKCEYKAQEWAILNCVPFDELVCACRSGMSNNNELAEYFGVSEPFIGKAIEYYLCRAGK